MNKNRHLNVRSCESSMGRVFAVDGLCYNHGMKTKSLIDTNPYLKDASMRVAYVARAVRTSCGVEGIGVKRKNAVQFDIPRRSDKKIYKTTK